MRRPAVRERRSLCLGPRRRCIAPDVPRERYSSTPPGPSTPAGSSEESSKKKKKLPARHLTLDERATKRPAGLRRTPPAVGRAGSLDCVHCGFCLPTCPTYALWGEEMDSPRGRIYLMKWPGRRALNGRWSAHRPLLGCMACLTACPSGVQYDKLIEATRAQVERRLEPPSVACRPLVSVDACLRCFPTLGRSGAAAAAPLVAVPASGLPRLLRRWGPLERIPPTPAAMEA